MGFPIGNHRDDDRREGDEPDPVYSAPDDPDDDAEESSLEQPPSR